MDFQTEKMEISKIGGKNLTDPENGNTVVVMPTCYPKYFYFGCVEVNPLKRLAWYTEYFPCDYLMDFQTEKMEITRIGGKNWTDPENGHTVVVMPTCYPKYFNFHWVEWTR
jgi:hypothetical protein